MSEAWSEAAFAHEPVAPAVGPFPHRRFLETWWDHHGAGSDLKIVTTPHGTLPLRVVDGAVEFCGNHDLTDYHSPLGDVAGPLAAAAEALSGRPFSLDSLPAEAASPLLSALRNGGHDVAKYDDTLTAVVDLKDGDWLGRLPKKQRHEIRRKQRRFTDQLGPWRLERRHDPDAVRLFADLHRDAPGAKGRFMSPQQEAFFADLVARTEASVEVLTAEERPVAAAFGWVRPDGYYLYNSGYATDAREASPGIVLLAALIDELVAAGVPRLDLLKGDEAYKFQLGATRRPLYRLEGRFS